MRQILGPGGFSYPMWLPRIVYPAAVVPRQPGNVVHKDYRSVQDMFTSWVPLGEVPRTLGGLAVQPGSQRTARVRHRPLDRLEAGWLTADYQAGDVLVFHCLTTHAALPNQEARMRFSAEYRWQLADQPAPRRMVIGPRGHEIGSRRFSRTGWWRPVPGGLTLFDDGGVDGRPRLPALPSRFVSFSQ
jgi:ectoine hydroxylase-related dioxygenase (phytanoyl-CoA dioxygenase family)